MSSDRNIASQVKHNHDAMVQIDDELKRLQAKRTELEERNELLLATLSNNTSPGTSVKGLNLSSECVLLLVLMLLVLALLYFGSWGPLVVSGIGTLFVVITLRKRRRRGTAARNLRAA